MKELKNYLQEPGTDLPGATQEFERAPVLDLLRGPTSQPHRVKAEYENEDDLPSPLPLSDYCRDELVREMSHPRKKPKLMAELERNLNRPV
jgi:hypothetical protein